MKSAPEKIAERKAPLDAKRGKRGGARPGAGRPKGIPNPGTGRKPVFEDSTNLNIRIDRATLKILEEFAKKTHQKKSVILRNLILENCG